MTRSNDATPGGGQADGIVATAKAQVQATDEAVDEAKQRFSDAVDARRGGAATSVEDALAKSGELRQALQRDVSALKARVPDGDALTSRARTYALAGAGGVAALALAGVALSRRGTRRDHEREVREQAEALARALSRVNIEDASDPGDARGGRGRWLLLAGAVGAAVTAWTQYQQPPEELDIWGPEA